MIRIVCQREAASISCGDTFVNVTDVLVEARGDISIDFGYFIEKLEEMRRAGATFEAEFDGENVTVVSGTLPGEATQLLKEASRVLGA